MKYESVGVFRRDRQCRADQMDSLYHLVIPKVAV